MKNPIIVAWSHLDWHVLCEGSLLCCLAPAHSLLAKHFHYVSLLERFELYLYETVDIIDDELIDVRVVRSDKS